MKIFYLLLIFAFQFVTPNVFSQTKDSVNKSWLFSMSFNGYFQSGNTNKFLVEGKGEIKRVKNKLESILTLYGSYGENRSNKDNNTYLGTFTADLFYENIFSPFALQYLEYNYAKGIELHSQSGAGLKYLFIPLAEHKSSISLAIIYDYLNLAAPPSNTDGKEARFSFRIKSNQILFDKNLKINFTGFYQPVINYFSKANIYVFTTLKIPLSDNFWLDANYSYTFDNIVSVGRKRVDNKLTFGGGIDF
jgi:Protein of unknown function, DUF481